MASLADVGEILVTGISEFFSNLGEDSEEIALEIDGYIFSGWKGVSLTSQIDDMVSTLGIEGPFDPDNADLKDAFEPFTYKKTIVYIGRDRVGTFTIESHDFGLGSSDRSVKLSCRSPAGVLCDTMIEAETAQYSGITLKQFFETVVQPFGDIIQIKFDADTDPQIGMIRPEPGQTYFDFLKKVYEPKGLIVTDDEFGRLVVGEKPTGEGEPVFSFIEGETKMDGLSAAYQGSERFSFYIVYGTHAGQNFKSEASDPVVNAKVFRPFVKVQSEGESRDSETAAAWERALAISRSISVSFSVPGWRREDGELWKKGDIVTIKAPSIYLYNETKFIVSGVSRQTTATSKKTDLKFILPQTYSRELPEVYPWD